MVKTESKKYREIDYEKLISMYKTEQAVKYIGIAWL